MSRQSEPTAVDSAVTDLKAAVRAWIAAGGEPRTAARWLLAAIGQSDPKVERELALNASKRQQLVSAYAGLTFAAVEGD